jgi:formylglycine-generating enzyme required for sulfatase activity
VAGNAAVGGDGGSRNGGGDSSGGAGEPEGRPGPSCNGLPANCGPDQQQSCCASHVVSRGTFLRDNGGPGDFEATISDFRLDDYEVTVGRFRNFVSDYAHHMPEVGSGRNPNNDLDPGWDAAWNASLPADEAELIRSVQVCDSRFTTYAADDATLPMNCITWFQAYAFCIWDGGRLPTDAETNYAAAGGAEQRMFPWSDPPDSEEIDAHHAVYLPEAEGPARVGSKSPLGDGKWGHADLSGNEWEWCQDWYRPYQGRCINCADLAMDYTIRVIRGGDFYSGKEALYSHSRLYHAPNQADFGVGVRCARAP